MILVLVDFLNQLNYRFAVFNYITLRAILSMLTALLVTLSLGPFVIRWLQKLQIGQAVRDCGPKTHLTKQGIPTMGGILILVSFILSSLIWADLSNKHVWVVLLVTLSFGLIGAVDDFLKVSKKNSQGLRSRWKYFWQSVCGLICAIFLYVIAQNPAETMLFVPFFKNVQFNLGLGFIVFTYLVIVGTSNAINLTDGLDGLAIVPTVMVISGLGIFCYVIGHFKFAQYLLFPHIAHVGELTVLCAGLAGAGLGFLWFNTYPAQMFMGDVGSLALGAMLGTVAVIARQELILLIMGGVFVAETLSVIIQVTSFKLTGKRRFLMAPLHHHFELKGWTEPKIIVRFWIITLILVLIGLSALKVR